MVHLWNMESAIDLYRLMNLKWEKMSDSDKNKLAVALQTVGVACTSMLRGSGLGRGLPTHDSSYYLVYYWGIGDMDIN
jgi:hypothetical protein